jgi:hypothetical protein
MADALIHTIKETGRFPTHVTDCSGETHRWVTISPRNELSIIVPQEGTSVSVIPLSSEQNLDNVSLLGSPDFYFADVTKYPS